MTGHKNNTEKDTNPLWGGHYTRGPAEIMEQINQSISFDKRLYKQDITGSKAHVQMLADSGIIADNECQEILVGLRAIEKDIESGNFTFKPELEDIHMNIEAALKEKIGDVSGKLHTARSRNDQVATDFRLWVRDSIDALDKQAYDLQEALINRSDEYAATLIPGFTHLQTAQPVTLGHHLLAYVEMFGRDRSRLADCRKRLNECPLGAAALAGTSFPINREQTAAALGFDCPTRNSIDAVSDRDFAIEFMSTASICMVHLSRLAEEFVLWSSKQFDFITLSEAFTSGSSIMPQKRNPDAAELVRAKSGRVFGNLTGLLTVMKALPLTYSKDMQEDKEPVFETADTLSLCLSAMTGMVEDFQANEKAMYEASQSGYSTATDLADWLVRELGMPFRQAHSVVGKIVQLAEKQGIQLNGLSISELQTVEPAITEDVFNVLSVENSVKSRTSFGGTAPDNVKQAITKARELWL